tara:strand:- start:26475 stop:26999 length:525 start_codon:yes stop_codon:yes gene_type:complete
LQSLLGFFVSGGKMNKARLVALGLSGVVAATGITIARYEGKELVGYIDPVGVVTSCYGHTRLAEVGKVYTDAECLELLAEDLEEHNQQLMQVVSVPLSRGEHIAYLSFHYNVGAGNFRRSSLLKLLNSGHRVRACNELQRWIYAGGRKLNGLIDRRDHERQLCLKGVNGVSNNL